MPLSRRELLRGTILLPLVALAGPVIGGCSDSGPVCVDPELLSAGEEQMRETLEYVARASARSKRCGDCQFFAANGEDDCGECEILDGAVSRQGYCTSWAERS